MHDLFADLARLLDLVVRRVLRHASTSRLASRVDSKTWCDVGPIYLLLMIYFFDAICRHSCVLCLFLYSWKEAFTIDLRRPNSVRIARFRYLIPEADVWWSSSSCLKFKQQAPQLAPPHNLQRPKRKYEFAYHLPQTILLLGWLRNHGIWLAH